MTKRKRTKGQTTIYTALYRKTREQAARTSVKTGGETPEW
jgi:hypothetical protein